MIKEIWMNKEKQAGHALYTLRTRDAETANAMLVARELMDLARMVDSPEVKAAMLIIMDSRNINIAQYVMAVRKKANEILAKVGQQS